MNDKERKQMSDMTNEKMFKTLREEGRQYRAKIKALQGLLDSQVKANCGIASRLCEVEKSRDKLLEELDDVAGFVLNNWNVRGQKIIKVVRKAQALKEKANETQVSIMPQRK